MFVHIHCLEHWRATGPKEAISCPQCKFQYKLGQLKTAYAYNFGLITRIMTNSPKMFMLSIAWLICSVGYLVHLLSELAVCETAHPYYPSEKIFGSSWNLGSWIDTNQALGFPVSVMNFLGVAFYILVLGLHGFGALVRLQLQRTEGPVSAFMVVLFHSFLAIGFIVCIVLVSSSQRRPWRSTATSQTNTRTYVRDVRRK